MALSELGTNSSLAFAESLECGAACHAPGGISRCGELGALVLQRQDTRLRVDHEARDAAVVIIRSEQELVRWVFHDASRTCVDPAVYISCKDSIDDLELPGSGVDDVARNVAGG